ncbi:MULTISPECIES: DUF2180 family protein [unclassified Streptomyces]|uniref:DUF2180 family protein n=1 Tax=unclassified Streptomyces TaxID=2593676 RepID=UPI000F448499|nr:DUF2180 family protein [Streptomyces sp. I6]RNL70133.1 DUF2180 family protein [Streptomyces sp. I6]
MDCHECRSRKLRTTAVAVCRECGVGLCGEHLYLGIQTVHGDAGLRKTTGGIPARCVLCSVCRRAEHGVWRAPQATRQHV